MIVEPRNSQAGSLEDRSEGFRLQNALAMDGNGDAMSKAVTNSQMQVYMASFLIEHHESGSPKCLDGILPGDPGKTGHYTATSSASMPFNALTFFSKMCS